MIYRETNFKRGTLPFLAVHGDGSSVRNHNALDDSQAQPGTLTDIFGSEEWHEELLLDQRAHAGARVFDRETYSVVPAARGDSECATARHRLNGVDHQVHEDLMQLRRIGHDPRQ